MGNFLNVCINDNSRSVIRIFVAHNIKDERLINLITDNLRHYSRRALFYKVSHLYIHDSRFNSGLKFALHELAGD